MELDFELTNQILTDIFFAFEQQNDLTQQLMVLGMVLAGVLIGCTISLLLAVTLK